MKRIICFLLALGMTAALFSGCQKFPGTEDAPAMGSSVSVSEPGPTLPADGNPGDVTCKGSYSGQGDPAAPVAQVGGVKLTAGLLDAFYWGEAAAYRQSGALPAPDFSQPLDSQSCPLDEGVNSWQQYFLRRALNAWHTAQALVLQSEDQPLPTEEAYQPDPEKHAELMTGMPATKFLYGYQTQYAPNSMHQAYLDSLPQRLESLAAEKGYENPQALAQQALGASLEDVLQYARLYNYAYMYFTTLTYGLEAPEAPQTVTGEPLVDIRQVLLYPKHPDNPWRTESVEEAVVGPDGVVTASEELWAVGTEQAQKKLNAWRSDRRSGEATFAELARKESLDTASSLDGGLYLGLSQGQLPPELDSWAFDASRQIGDSQVLRSDYGLHLVYFVGKTGTEEAAAQAAQTRQQQEDLLRAAREKYPMTVDYSAITLGQAQPEVSVSELLYPDVAHERFPEAPLYLQQDYPTTMYGNYPIRTHGCGITTMAMLASYMTDTELTPPEMCRRYGSYSHKNGTDGLLFNRAPAEMGFYLRKKTHDPKEAKQALEDGYPLVVVQRKGFWTRGGHYLLVEKMLPDGRIQVRDSNLLNYGRLADHKQDSFDWSTIPPACVGYWVFEPKITTIPACSRCGDPDTWIEGLTPQDYICEKCTPALARRNTFLACGDLA